MKPVNLKEILVATELYYIKSALRHSENVARAAALLGLNRTTLVEKMRRYKIKIQRSEARIESVHVNPEGNE